MSKYFDQRSLPRKDIFWPSEGSERIEKPLMLLAIPMASIQLQNDLKRIHLFIMIVFIYIGNSDHYL